MANQWAGRSTIDRLGAGWEGRLQVLLNEHHRYEVLAKMRISMSTLEKLIETSGLQKHIVYTQPGERLVIERGGDVTVISDRTAE